jgi:hypothetical protein
MAACGSDDTNDGTDNNDTIGLDSAISTADTLAPSVSVADENADEGTAMDAATMAMESMMTMADGGEPTIANFDAAAAALPAGIELTGLDDDNEDGRDDDAKATVEANGGEDKACLQQQDGVWEVTDDEC